MYMKEANSQLPIEARRAERSLLPRIQYPMSFSSGVRINTSGCVHSGVLESASSFRFLILPQALS